MNNYKDLGNRYIKYRKKRAALVAFSMVLATIFIYAVTTAVVNLWTGMKAIELENNNYHVEIPDLSMEQCEKIRNYSTVRNADFMSLDEKQVFMDFYGDNRLLIYYMDDVNQSTFNFKLIEGEYPQNDTEIIIDKAYMHLFKEDIKVGSKIKTLATITEGFDAECKIVNEIEYEYTVVGIYEYAHPDSYIDYTMAYSKATDDMNMTAYVRFDNGADWSKYAETLANDIGVDTSKNKAYFINKTLEEYYFKGESMSYIAMFLMLMLFIVYSSMVMIRGLFTANLMDNITEFNILKAMGATDKKIKKIFKREVYLEGIVAFIIGFISTHFLFFILTHIVNMGAADFSFNPIALLLAFVFLYITITLAVIEPFSLLRKVPIVEGIRASYAINNTKEKKRRGKIFRIFGIEGEYAYKNIRRNGKSFWNSVATFTVSVLVLTVLVTVLVNIEEQLELEAGLGSTQDLYDYSTRMGANDKEHVDRAQEAFDKANFIKSADPDYIYLCNAEDIAKNLMLTEEIESLIENKKIELEELPGCVVFYTEGQLEKLNSYMMDGVDARTIRDGGAILVNSYDHWDAESDIKGIKVWDAKIGETVMVDTAEHMVEWNKVKEDTDLKKAFNEKEPPKDEIKLEGFCKRSLAFDSVVLILSYDYYVEQYGQDLSFLCQGFLIDVDEEKFKVTDMADFELIIYEEAAQYKYDFMNMTKFIDEQTRPVKAIAIGIVIFVLLMGIVNILNNMINEYQVRRREVSILRAIGMSKKKLNSMLILERVIIGLIAWVIGTVLGFVFSEAVLTSLLYLMEATMVVPWLEYLLIGAGVVGIMVLISMIMVVSMGKKDITDGIRNQE